MAQAMIDFENFSQFQSQSRLEQEQEKDVETLLSTFTEEIGSQQDQNFSQDDNDVPKKKKKERKKQQNKIIAIQNLKQEIYWQMFLIEDLSKKILLMQVLSLIFCRLLCSTLL